MGVGDRFLQEAPADKRSQCYIGSASHKRLGLEWRYAPYQSDEICDAEAHPRKSDKPPPNCTLVYIRNFTNVNHDFAYIIHGIKNLGKFWAGVHGATSVG